MMDAFRQTVNIIKLPSLNTAVSRCHTMDASNPQFTCEKPLSATEGGVRALLKDVIPRKLGTVRDLTILFVSLLRSLGCIVRLVAIFDPASALSATREKERKKWMANKTCKDALCGEHSKLWVEVLCCCSANNNADCRTTTSTHHSKDKNGNKCFDVNGRDSGSSGCGDHGCSSEYDCGSGRNNDISSRNGSFKYRWIHVDWSSNTIDDPGLYARLRSGKQERKRTSKGLRKKGTKKRAGRRSILPISFVVAAESDIEDLKSRPSSSSSSSSTSCHIPIVARLVRFVDVTPRYCLSWSDVKKARGSR